MGKYLDAAKKVEARLKAEGRLPSQRPASLPQSASSQQEVPADYHRLYEGATQAIPEEFPTVDAWLCEHCNNPAAIDGVVRSLDGTRMLTLWSCEPCQTYGVTPDSIRQPPVWVPRTVQ